MALPGGHVAAAAIFGTIACLLGLAAFLYLFRCDKYYDLLNKESISIHLIKTLFNQFSIIALLSLFF
jgi:hypothetical protein